MKNIHILTYSIIIITFIFLYPTIQQPPLCSLSSTTSCLPCSQSCSNCSSSSVCNTCSLQYYPSINNGALLCLPCGSYCLTCTNNSICTQCQNPYVLVNNICTECQIPNALQCSNTVSASKCIDNYYVGDNYCHSCLLHCLKCLGNSDCQTCQSGYTLNSTIQVCMQCQSGCQTCNQLAPTICTKCYSGYQLIGSSCSLISCSINNCKYCNSNGLTCDQCNYGYYWNSANNQCSYGSSVLCVNGAIGKYSSDCINSCGSYQFTSKSYSSPSRIQCTPYKNIDLNSVNYKQYYYYAFNDYSQMVGSLSASQTNSLQYDLIIGQYVFNFQQLVWNSLIAYYRIDFFIKYSSSVSTNLTLSATTETITQTENLPITSSSSNSKIVEYTTLALHSNNLKISTNGTSINLIQIFFRLSICSSGCDRCLNKQLCQLCTAPQYMLGYKCVDNCSVYYHLIINRTCVVSCPNSYYHNTITSTNKVCQPCASPCVDCISQTQCVTCINTKFLLGYACLDICPDGYFGLNGKCQVCISPCKTCSSQATCLSCDQGFWNGTNCTAFCPSGTFGNQLTKVCQICTSPCVTCRNSSTFCTSCSPSNFLHNFQCLTVCPDRYYPSGLSCIPCTSPCYTCTNSINCLSCAYNFLNSTNGQCINDCGAGFYGDLILRTCLACNADCKTCINSNGCQLCKDNNKCLYGVSCVSSCPSNSWYGKTALSSISGTGNDCFCQQCNYPCKTCSDSTQCLSCLSGYLYQNSCVTQCPSSYYTNLQTLECTLCSTSFQQCASCTENACLVCNIGYFLHNGLCVNACPTLYYQSNQQCFKCIAPCQQCTGFSTCITCISPYIKYNTGCIIQCPIGTLSQNGTCVSCISPCLTCSSTITACTLCITGWFLNSNSNTCIQNCSAIAPIDFKFYQQPLTSSCSPCMFPCDTCTSQTFCKSCRIGYLTSLTGKCKDCSAGTYTSLDQTQCLACPIQCTTCVSTTLCTACNQNYYLYMNQCTSNVSICQANGYYASGRVCQPCRAPCQKCTGTATTCTTCLTGYIFFTNTATNINSCISECPIGYFRNGSICSQCHPACTQCITSATYCLSCNSPNLLHLATSSCIGSCPDGTYTSGTLCVACKYPCQNCISQLQCLSCVSGTLINQKCYSVCPNGQFTNSQSVCQVCTSPCKQCLSIDTNCTQCISSTYLLNNQCLNSCPSGYFPQNQSLQCLQCSSNCKQCTDNINCTACNSDKIYYYNNNTNYAQCVIDCPQGFYKISDTSGNSAYKCQACNVDCLTCSNGVDCLLCKNGKVQHNGQCLTSCPSQMYAFQGVCQQCTLPCLDCTDSFTCTSCVNSSYLLLGSAQCIQATVCPQGYYLLASLRQCNTQCPSGYYHNNDRTCNQQGCGDNQFKGNDYFCYTQCPANNIGNISYFCHQCQTGQSCSGLYFDIISQIKRDQLTFVVTFTETPIYKVNKPAVSINPDLSHQIVSYTLDQTTLALSNLNPLINQSYMASVAPYNGSTTLVIKINPTQSISQTIFTVSFLNSFTTFDNPLQLYTRNLDFAGYDYFNCVSTPLASIGFIFLALAVIGIASKYQIIDFAQIIFLLGLLNVHYPCHLAQFLEGSSFAHLKGLFNVAQSADIGIGKFSYVSTMGLLTNALPMLIILVIGAVIGLIFYLVKLILQKKLSYNRVHQQSDLQVNNKKKDQIIENQNQNNSNENQAEKGTQDTCAYKIYKWLDQVCCDFRTTFVNRWIYFTYTTLCLYTFTQLWAFNFSFSLDMIASILSILLVILLPIWGLSFLKDHPKFTFLYARKFVITLSVVLSTQNPIYAVGVISVCNLTAGILISSYKLQKWKVDTKILFIGQISQFILQIFFAIYLMVPQGSYTQTRFLLAWIIVLLILAIGIFYLGYSIFEFVLFVISKIKGIDYKKKWIQQQQNKDDTDVDSQSQNSSMKQNQSKKGKNKSVNGDQIATNIAIPFFNKNQKVFDKDLQKGRDQPSQNNSNNGYGTADLFWTYNDMDNDNQDDDEKKPPRMLVRCVNQFSDYQKSQKSVNQDESKNS